VVFTKVLPYLSRLQVYFLYLVDIFTGSGESAGSGSSGVIVLVSESLMDGSLARSEARQLLSDAIMSHALEFLGHISQSLCSGQTLTSKY
jgi:hypothetical protein